MPAEPPSDGSPPRPPRRALPLRVQIAALFVLLIAAAALAVGGYGYLATSRLLLSAGDEEFLNVAERTSGQVRSLLAPVQLLVQLLARHRLADTTTLDARMQAIPFLATALAELPHVSAVYAGFDTGDFFLVRPLSDAWGSTVDAPNRAAFLVQSRTGGQGRYLFLDSSLATMRDEPRPDYRFDPRTRDWYRQARAGAAVVRTSPYVFFTTREVGTTLAQRTANGAGVIGVDITLRTLSSHLSDSRVTPSARIALVDSAGLVIAHPEADRLVRTAPGGGAGLLRLADLGDQALEPLLTSAVSPSRGTPLTVAGRPWVGVRRSIEAAAGEPLILLVAAPRSELVAGARGLAQRQILIGLGVLGLASGLVWLFARRLSRPLEALTRSVAGIGRGDLDTPLPEIETPAEVAALSHVAERMRGLLKRHIQERAVRLADEQRRARELEIARQIQLSMLPPPPAEALDGRFAIAATLLPAREVGGDLYDFLSLDGRRLVFVIADVADKGVPAALLMARVTGLFRAIARSETGPDAILRELDARLSQGNDACMFVTAGCGQLDGESGELRYASAGHDPPLLRRVDGVTEVLSAEGGPALGLDLADGFPLWTGRLAPGDALVLWTDGVTEAFDAAGAAFGLARLRPLVTDTPPDALAALPARLVEEVERFAAGGGPRDDLTLLAVQYRPRDVLFDPGGAWRLAVAGEPESVARARRRIEAILRARHVPSEIVHDCALAAEEVLANIAEHAYAGQPGGIAHVEVRLLPEEIRLRFEDSGPPFDPLKQPPPDLDAPIESRGVGGLGILLVRHLVDRCDYAREGAVNVLTMSRRRPPEPGDAAPPAAEADLGDATSALEIGISDLGLAGRRVVLRGRLDTATAPSVDAALAAVLDAPAVRALAFDLHELEYISSAGIRCFLRARRALAGRGGRVTLVRPRPAVRRVLEILKVVPPDDILASDPDPDAPLRTP